ncbi:MAG: hypothetical protein JNM52_07395 [Betaproteobacteria bacterium]|nr:hypothetical protein [Betaproteobacteria bacterium]
MSMKKTDLEKNKMMKTANQMKATAITDRYGKASVVPDRKEQRKLDQAAGLVPFACKLNGELVKRLHAEAATRQVGLNELLADLLAAGLAGK